METKQFVVTVTDRRTGAVETHRYATRDVAYGAALAFVGDDIRVAERLPGGGVASPCTIATVAEAH